MPALFSEAVSDGLLSTQTVGNSTLRLGASGPRGRNWEFRRRGFLGTNADNMECLIRLLSTERFSRINVLMLRWPA
jgi:hypothetical protein